MDDTLVHKMAQAGCVNVALGFESGADAILKNMNKKFLPQQIKDSAFLFRKYGINQMGFLLLGGPGETRETVMQSLEFGDSLELEMMKVTNGIRIYPLTELARIALKENIIDASDNLLFPKFYLTPELNGWLQETTSQWLESRPAWIL